VTAAASGVGLDESRNRAPRLRIDALWLRRLPWLAGGVAVTTGTLLSLLGIASRAYVYEPLEALDASPRSEASTEAGEASPAELKTLEGKARRSRASLAALAPGSVYIVVDTARNRLSVRRSGKTLLEAVCSTGSGTLLKDPETRREWLFETPRGRFHVLRKAQDPVWTKPDWAFVEEGKPVPEKWSERRDPNTLGDYALYLGDGYMIHGTLYQRYLGQSVTHGCVRLGDADLERVFRMTPVGAPVFIF
jgi:L,D-transpeptidase catalytic domain